MSRNSLPHISVPASRRAVPEDLEHLPQVEALLSALNDPYVGIPTLALLVDKIPLLRARCQREAFLLRPSWRIDNSEIALRAIGNKGLEKTLLELLEDLTVLKAELEDLGSLAAPVGICPAPPRQRR